MNPKNGGAKNSSARLLQLGEPQEEPRALCLEDGCVPEPSHTARVNGWNVRMPKVGRRVARKPGPRGASFCDFFSGDIFVKLGRLDGEDQDVTGAMGVPSDELAGETSVDLECSATLDVDIADFDKAVILMDKEGSLIMNGDDEDEDDDGPLVVVDSDTDDEHTADDKEMKRL